MIDHNNAVLKPVLKALRDAPRIGADKDIPEGTRYIQISDTLALKMERNIEYLINILK